MLLVASVVFAQNPMGVGRPPGFGPELDHSVIAQMQDLQRFLARDLGFVTSPTLQVRDGVVTRRFWGSFELKAPYRSKFEQWKHKILTTPGWNGLGIDVSKMDYVMALVQVDYNGTQLGDYSAFRSSASAHAQLAADAKKFYDMAQGYIDRLEARLKFESEHSRFAPGGGIDPAHPDWPKKPMMLLNVIGEERTRTIIEGRRKK